ncbi:hypothetical protein SK854_22230 [Lentzea sp. BCCO 10_0061]|uniref:Uncharacterized protein n=1 Tax=Lentzea sokolovensis TaxID=3095429 RepID=A0ABU4V1Q7_9PSEU|nr:hypothetical protein [Lentzea sp. BCCO 10_0061]MDX8144845.1 hypothetical protein [Lentzea sp. BCCO 10_0061]
MNLVVRAEHQSLWLCFEPWANQHTLLPGTSVVVRFPPDTEVEVVHHRDGMTFFNVGAHPDLYEEDGTALEIYSEYMPVFPADLPIAGLRLIMEIVPPIRDEPDRLN